MFRYQSFQTKQVSKAAGDVPPYPLTLADNGNLLLDFKTFTLYFFNLFFRNFLILILLHFRIWHFFAENVKIVLSESWETLIMHLSVFVFVFCLQLYLLLFVYLYFWPILSRPKCDYGEHRRRSEVTFTFEDCLRAASAATHISGNNQKKTKKKILEKF